MIGEINTNSKGTPMMIVAERNSNDIDIEFLDEHHYVKTNQAYSNFKRGTIKNPFDKTIFNMGYLGDTYSHFENGNHNPEFVVWRHMIGRCSGHIEYARSPKCCNEWLCFDTFRKWYFDHWYDIGDERLHLDKDIRYKGNLTYSPYHCILVPQSINEQFKETSGKKTKDTDLPYTIRRTNTGKYKVSYIGKNLGTFNTVEECVSTYVNNKKKHIEELVSRYNTMPEYIREIVLNATL